MTRRNAQNLIFRAALSAVLLALLTLPLSALQYGRGYSDIRIYVKDLHSGQTYADIEPGETFTLPEGARVRLILAARSGGHTIYPRAEIAEARPGGRGVRITKVRVENSNATVEIVPLGRRDRRVETLTFRILGDDRVPRQLWHGSFRIAVYPFDRGRSPYSPPGRSHGGWNSAWPQEMTRTLYRAILLREPDPQAWGTTQAIAEGGYPAIVRSAEAIASSEESRWRLHQRDDVSNEARLRALYDELLELEPHEVDRSEWFRDLSLVSSGRIEVVVSEMVRSERFRAVHELSAFG